MQSIKRKSKVLIEQLESRLHLAAHTWTGNGGNAYWSNAANWSGGAPTSSESNVTLDFPSGVTNTSTYDDISGLTVSTMSFEGIYSMSGGAFNLNGTLSTSASGNPNFVTGIVLTGNSTFDLIGQMNYYGSISGSYGLTYSGGGAIWQEGANTYTGATVISNGLVVDDSDTGLGSTSDVTLDSSGTLQMQSTIVQDVASFNGSGTITGSGSVIDQTSGYDTFSGQLTGSAEFAVSASGRVTVSATGSGTGQVVLFSGEMIYDGDLPDASLVQTGGELFGTGTAGSLTASGGSMEPGDYSPGALNAGALNLEAGSWVDWVAVNDTSYESYVATSSVTLGGSFGINLIMTGYTPAIGKVFTLIKNESGNAVSGTFQGMADGSTFEYQNANWQISYNGGGEHDVTLTYLGLATNTALATAASPAAFGQTVLHATVTSTGTGASPISGTVTFKNGSNVIGTANIGSNGVATFDATSLPVGGPYTITATYGGDSIYEASGPSSSISQTVNQAMTTISVVPSASSLTAGAPVALTATVNETDSSTEPTGSVIFLDNGTSIGSATINNNGHASLQGVTLPAGEDVITATYAGDTNFLGSATSGATDVTVVPSIAISSEMMTKSSTGVTSASFIATLSASSNLTVTFNYSTQDGSAVAGRDYTASTGAVTFAPGQTSKTVTVPVMGGTDWEEDRSFSLTVSSVVNANGPTASPTATIQSTDGMPTAGLVPDELDPNQTDLVIDGGSGNDTIQLKSTRIAGQIQVVVNHKVVATDSNLDRLIIYGGSGNNTLTVAPKISAGVIFFGGAGRNVLTGGTGNDILVGGGGANTLAGGAGANLLIGGSGPAHLKGSALGDVLVGGSTPYDAGTLSDIQKLEGLLQTWTDGSSYANRVAELTSGASVDSATISDANVTLVSGDKATGKANHDLILVEAPVKPAKK